MEELSLIQIAGVIGFCGYISNFVALQFGILHGNSNTYSLLSIASAGLVLISLTEHFNLAAALIQICWIGIGFSAILYRTFKSGPRHIKLEG